MVVVGVRGWVVMCGDIRSEVVHCGHCAPRRTTVHAETLDPVTRHDTSPRSPANEKRQITDEYNLRFR